VQLTLVSTEFLSRYCISRICRRKERATALTNEHVMSHDQLKVDDYFLSATNPLATADQRDIEQRALMLMDTPAYRQARAATERRWREWAGTLPSQEAWGRFETLIDECAFAALLKALNGDPHYPHVVRIVMPPHQWFGMSVPGSRFGGGPGAIRATRSSRSATAGAIASMADGLACRRSITTTRFRPMPIS
jgi:hypothetical protein